MGRKIFAGFAAVLLIAMTALIPALMDLREILLALGTGSGQAALDASGPPLAQQTAERVAALAAHAYSFGAIGTMLLIVTSLLIAYAVTRAVNLPLLTIWQQLSGSVKELNAVAEAVGGSDVRTSEAAVRRASASAGEMAEQLGSILGVGDSGAQKR